VAALKPGAIAPVRLQRRDETMELKVTPGVRPKQPRALQQR
jgi:serine protease DegQ